ncbi:MAG: MoaD/ThiS family protein [Polyangiaceae bacterium]|nr:MoaD/ThiS family protein [Myxococcales bacterium]MCB9589430.1 MoaD/ThiS family protein [Polyangiaceae bacterium]
MARVELTRHLYEYFPKLSEIDLEVDAPDVAGVIAELERRMPGFAFYVCDEAGRLRQHVNIFVGDDMIADRRSLTDTVQATTRVLIMQALSGG